MRTEWEIESYTEKILVSHRIFPSEAVFEAGLSTLRLKDVRHSEGSWSELKQTASPPPSVLWRAPHRLDPLPRVKVSGAWELWSLVVMKSRAGRMGVGPTHEAVTSTPSNPAGEGTWSGRFSR